MPNDYGHWKMRRCTIIERPKVPPKLNNAANRNWVEKCTKNLATFHFGFFLLWYPPLLWSFVHPNMISSYLQNCSFQSPEETYSLRCKKLTSASPVGLALDLNTTLLRPSTMPAFLKILHCNGNVQTKTARSWGLKKSFREHSFVEH